MSTIWMPAQMALFAKIVDLNGFSAAARALGVPKAAASRAIAELEAALGIPEGQLVHTVDTYNRFAARGEDPLFHKAAEFLRPLGEGPYGALDCTTSGSIYAGFTFGGLATRASGEVLDPTGTPIPGLYAAGRVAAGLPLEGRTYASGLSIGDATFFGRLCGRNAAAAPAAD